MTQIQPDGENCTAQIIATDAAGKGTTKILVKGSLGVECGIDPKTTEAKELTLKAKEELSLGDFTMKVTQANPTFAQINAAADKLRPKQVEFLDDKGKVIMTGPPNRYAFTPFGGKKQSGLNDFLHGKQEKVTVKLTYFEKVETATVPLDLSVGLGLE